MGNFFGDYVNSENYFHLISLAEEEVSGDWGDLSRLLLQFKLSHILPKYKYLYPH